MEEKLYEVVNKYFEDIYRSGITSINLSEKLYILFTSYIRVVEPVSFRFFIYKKGWRTVYNKGTSSPDFEEFLIEHFNVDYNKL